MTEKTKLMQEIANIRLLRRAKGKMLDRLQVRQVLLNELKELEPFKNSQDLHKILLTEKYISKAKEYCDLLKDFSDGNEEYNRLFKVLDCLKLDSNYTLALHCANDEGSFGDVSWFYCYEGCNDIFRERFNHPDRDKMVDFFQCMGNLSEYQIFDHLRVEATAMGAWQAFLLSIALSQLPTFWHGGYRRCKIIFGKEDLDNRLSLFKRIDFSNITFDDDLKPWASIEGNTATVSCCFWNNWRGLYRETVKIEFENGRVTFADETDIKELYKFHCGIRF